MSYKSIRHGERGRRTEGFAHEPTGYATVGQIPGGFPGFPGMLPGPPSRHPGVPGPSMPTSIFPTHTRVGDVVTITGPFAGLIGGQVRVKFQGTGWMSPSMIGPATASIVVPPGAENGLCEVEINGRRVFGTNCIVDPGEARGLHHGGVYGRRGPGRHRVFRRLRAMHGLGADAPALRPAIAVRDTFSPSEPRFRTRRVTRPAVVTPTASQTPAHADIVAKPQPPSTRHGVDLYRAQIRANMWKQRVAPPVKVVVNVEQPRPAVRPAIRASAAEELLIEPPPEEVSTTTVAIIAAAGLGFLWLMGRKK